MLLLSNCLTDVADEGCLKVANSLAKRVKAADRGVTVVSFERRSALTDIHMDVNKLLISGKLLRLIRKRREPILYIPFPTRSLPNAFRIFLLSLVSREQVKVVLTMTRPYSGLSRLLLRLSGAQLFALSGSAAEFYRKLVGKKRVTYLKCGVDTERFTPVSPEQAAALKVKYGLDPNRRVVLHVGHMKGGRNVAKLMELDPRDQGLLVVSTFTSSDADTELRKQLESCENIKIIDSYIENIQQIYQLADVYLFPVIESGNCIDVPLSCLEAAACGKPVVTTGYGEMREFDGKEGFYLTDKLETEEMNGLIRQAAADTGKNPRDAVMEYDWKLAVDRLLA